MSDFAPTQMRYFWGRSTGPVGRIIGRVTAPLSWLLTFRTGRIPSHMGIILSSPTEVVYGEAHFDSHWRYPLPIHLLTTWRDHQRGRILWVGDPLPIDPAYLPRIHAKALQMVPHWRYSRKQLIQLWLWRRLHIPIDISDGHVVCSEAAGRIPLPLYALHVAMSLAHPEYLTPANTWFHFHMHRRPPYLGDGQDLLAPSL